MGKIREGVGVRGVGVRVGVGVGVEPVAENKRVVAWAF